MARNKPAPKPYFQIRGEFTASLVDQDGETIFDQDDGYVPGFMPGQHYGDYVILDIDLDDGRITNWKKVTPEQIEEWIRPDKMTDTSSLSHLIERLEKASGPDRELGNDVLLACGWVCEEHGNGGPDTYLTWAPSPDDDDFLDGDHPDPTSSIDAAMTLVPEGMEKDFTDLYGVARVSVGINANPGPFYGTHEGGSLAIALCIASLKARLHDRD